MGYSLLEPFGQDRADDGARMIAALIYNTKRGKNDKAIMPDELMKPWQPKEQLDEMARIERLAAWFDARVETVDG